MSRSRGRSFTRHSAKPCVASALQAMPSFELEPAPPHDVLQEQSALFTGGANALGFSMT